MRLAFSRTAFSSHPLTCVPERSHHFLICSLLCTWCCAKCWGRSSGHSSTSEAPARWIPSKALLIPLSPFLSMLPTPHSSCPLSSHLPPCEDPEGFIPHFCAFALYCRGPPSRLSSLDPKLYKQIPSPPPLHEEWHRKGSAGGHENSVSTPPSYLGPDQSGKPRFPIQNFLFSPRFLFLWIRMVKRGN